MDLEPWGWRCVGVGGGQDCDLLCLEVDGVVQTVGLNN